MERRRKLVVGAAVERLAGFVLPRAAPLFDEGTRCARQCVSEPRRLITTLFSVKSLLRRAPQVDVTRRQRFGIEGGRKVGATIAWRIRNLLASMNVRD